MRIARYRQINWTLLLSLVVGGSLLLLSLIVYSPYGDLLNILIIVPIVCLLCLLLMATSAMCKRPRQFLSVLLTLLTFVAVSGALHIKKDTVRASVRWLPWSERFKAEVLAQPSPRAGELRHMEWEATGFAGVANNTLYLVFDPSDALENVTRPGKVAGIPCEVPVVQRLEKHWYAVRFYTDEEWGECPWSSTTQH